MIFSRTEKKPSKEDVLPELVRLPDQEMLDEGVTVCQSVMETVTKVDEEIKYIKETLSQSTPPSQEQKEEAAIILSRIEESVIQIESFACQSQSLSEQGDQDEEQSSVRSQKEEQALINANNCYATTLMPKRTSSKALDQ